MNSIFGTEKVSTGFKTPASYFEGVETDFTSKLKEDSLPKNSPFNVPENYFDTIEERILAKVITVQKTKVISLKRRIIQWIPASAAAAVIIFVSVFFMQQPADPSEEEIISWFETRLNSVTTDDLAIAFEDTDLDNDDFTALLTVNDLEDYFENEDNTTLLYDLEEE